MPTPGVTTGLVSQWLLDGDLTDNWSTNDASDDGLAGGLVAYVADVPSSLNGVVSQSRSEGRAFAPADLLSSNVCTYCCWAKFNSTAGYKGIMSIFTDNGDSMELFLNNLGSQLYGGNLSNRAFSGVGSLSTGIWYHLALVSDGSITQLYIDGSPVGTTGTTNFATFSDNFWIASRDNRTDFNFRGNLCDCRLYSNAVSASDLATIAAGDYGGGGPPVPPTRRTLQLETRLNTRLRTSL